MLGMVSWWNDLDPRVGWELVGSGDGRLSGRGPRSALGHWAGPCRITVNRDHSEASLLAGPCAHAPGLESWRSSGQKPNTSCDLLVGGEEGH